ncbi:MAG: ABC transporter ATP-binding protein, partial [Actinomycetales bacterium]
MASVTLQDLTKVFPNGSTAVDRFSIEVADGEFLVLVGPSGCGKTTALRMVAGLEEITSGTVKIGDDVVNSVPPRGRDIAMVFQSYALYPHMTVRQNIGYALKVRRLPKADIAKRVEAAAELLDLTPYLERKPAQLSGGQRQRVAMGRAIVREPKLFLMDEPLSNLDAKLRVQMRAEIAELQDRLGVTTIYVTHDQVEAMTMGDRVAVMRLGKLQQVATPRELYDNPANVFVAGFMGTPPMNLMHAGVRTEAGLITLRVGSQEIGLPAEHPLAAKVASRNGAEVILGFRPERITMSDVDGSVSLGADIRLVEVLGGNALVHFRLDARPVAVERLSSGLPGADDEVGSLAAREGCEILASLPVDVEVRVGVRATLHIPASNL